MDYISEEYSTREVLLSGQRIAIPGGRENDGGEVSKFLESFGLAPLDTAERCLHRDS